MIIYQKSSMKVSCGIILVVIYLKLLVYNG